MRNAAKFLRSTPWSTLIGTLMLLAIALLMAFYEEHLYLAQRMHQTQVQAEILASSVAAALAFDDTKTMGGYVQPLRVNPEIQAVGVYSSDGTLKVGYTRPGNAPPPNRLGDARSETTGDSLLVIAPVVQDGTPLGTVYLRSNSEPRQQRLTRYGILIFMLAMGGLVIVARWRAVIRINDQARSLADANGRLQREITERAKAEEALRQSQKMEAIGQLSAGIAHDFNNCLMIIKGNLLLLQRKSRLVSADQHLQSAMVGIDRATTLTRAILAFSRKQELLPKPVEISELVEAMDVLLRNSLHENIEVVKECKARWWATLDRNQMETAILNLVLNARDAMPLGGKLVLRTEDVAVAPSHEPVPGMPAGDYVSLTVRDTGTGMSEEVSAKALDPFFTTKSVGQGTGLGLSITYGFVSQSGGFMRIDSAPGRGTAVTIFLPRTSVPSTAATLH